MNEKQFREFIDGQSLSNKYQLLGRMQDDCQYFLGNGNRRSKLWGGSIKMYIKFMKIIYSVLPIKPEWLTLKEIKQYKKQMY